MKKLATIYCLILLGSVPTRAHAADGSDPWAVQNLHLELGGFVGLFLPSSRHELYDFDVATHKALKSVNPDLGLRLGFFPSKYVGLELEGDLIPTGVKVGTGSAQILGFRAQLVGQLPGRFTPFLTLGTGVLSLTSDATVLGDDADAEFHYGIGAKYYFTKNIGARLDARHLLTPGYRGGPNDADGNAGSFQLLLGLTVAFGRHAGGPPDRDGDGIADATDSCPAVAGTAPDGCPDVDGDGDGIKDSLDQCPAVKGEMKNGCPKDSDGDGIIDRKDDCPNEAGPGPTGCPKRDVDGDGVLEPDDKCPEVAAATANGCPPDGDDDGVPDSVDVCPARPGTEPNGCPPDSDGDGIYDPDDQCKDQPETKNGFQDADGCPDEIPKAVAKFTGAIRGINFGSGSSKIATSSNKVLDGAVKLLTEYQDLRIEVGGYTDDLGDDQNNLRLSQERADAVKAYFVAKGIDAERIKSVGYGEASPLATNKTSKGRAENRRIEFKLIQ